MDNFDQNVFIGDTAGCGNQKVMVSNSSFGRELTVSNNDGNSTTNEITANVQTLEKNLSDRINREIGNIVGYVEDRIQNAILTATDNNVTPRIELAVSSINASSRRDAASVTANSERERHTGITTSFEKVR